MTWSEDRATPKCQNLRQTNLTSPQLRMHNDAYIRFKYLITSECCARIHRFNSKDAYV